MNILFVVVLVVVWAVGGIVKAKAKQSQQQNKRQPSRKASARSTGAGKDPGELILEKLLGISVPLSQSRQRPAGQQAGQQKTSKSLGTASPHKHKLVSKPQTGKTVPIQKIRQMQESKFSLPSSSLEPNIQELPKIDTQIHELPDFTSETVKKLKDGSVANSSGLLKSKYLPELLSVYSSPDELRKAILHYEILGPPLSIRGSSGSFL